MEIQKCNTVAEVITHLSKEIRIADAAKNSIASGVLRINRATSYLSIECHAKAAKDASDAIERLSSQDPAAQFALSRALLLLGIAEYGRGRQRRAVAMWSRALQKMTAFSDLSAVSQIEARLAEVTSNAQASEKTVDEGRIGHRECSTAKPGLSSLQSARGCMVSGWLSVRQPMRVSLGPSDVEPDEAARLIDEVEQSLGDEAPVAEKILYGNMLVNLGRYDRAKQLFSVLVETSALSPKQAVSAHVGLGSVSAIQDRLFDALESFSRALQVDKDDLDARTRRGQVFASLGKPAQALEDLSMALRIAKGQDAPPSVRSELFKQRGIVLLNVGDAAAAREDLRVACEANPQDSIAWNGLGQAEMACGETLKAIECHHEAMTISLDFKEAMMNLATAYRALAMTEEALKVFDQIQRLDPSYPLLYQSRALFHHSTGCVDLALADAVQAVSSGARDSRNLHLLGMLCQSLGHLRGAMLAFRDALRSDPTSPCYFSAVWASYLAERLDAPMTSFCADRDVSGALKEGQCRTETPCEMRSDLSLRINWTSDAALAPPVCIFTGPCGCPAPKMYGLLKFFSQKPFAAPPAMRRLAAFAADVGRWLQLRSAGFTPNRRQFRQFGYATLEVAQLFMTLLDEVELEPEGTLLPNDASSCRMHPRGGSHRCNWRDLYDIAVRWRRISEPNDPVWWIDGFPKKSFGAGFGLQTSILNGHLKVTRYYPYFPKALQVLKDGMKKDVFLVETSGERQRQASRDGRRVKLGEHQMDRVDAASTLKEVYAILGSDFWIETPCFSSLGAGVIREGTRLTLLKKTAASGEEIKGVDLGFDFMIRTASTPERWTDMSEEMAFAFCEMRRSARLLKQDRRAAHVDAFTTSALKLFYYWVCFAPLTRGTAAVGYAVLRGVLLAMGVDLKDQMKAGVQMDWEAILAGHPDQFVAEVRDWFFASRCDATWIDQVPLVGEVLPTLRDRLQALNLESEENKNILGK